jgi:putative oxygen-independent coproporphyrinogen III oxidase
MIIDSTEPFGVYVHWPFCASKCPYCDFNSHVRFQPPDQARFVAAFAREIGDQRAKTGPRVTTSVFFGGGTPSLMTPETVAQILAAIHAAWPIEPGSEITLEANPSSVEAGRFRGYRAAGVNRVSLGVQSLVDADLKALGRLHSVADARAAIDIAAETFDRFSFDLIYARTGQTEAAWEAELSSALAIGSRHLSLYQLTIEPDTPFHALHASGRLKIPDEDLADRLYQLTDAMTSAAGLPGYEISNYAAPGQESRHNQLYWRYGEYAGVGPGAHGRIITDGVRHATETVRAPEAWLAAVEAAGTGVSISEPLTAREQADEALLMGLRLAEGLDLARLASLGGGIPSQAAVTDLVAIGMLDGNAPAGRLRASSAGRFVLNAIVAQLSASIGAPAMLAASGPVSVRPTGRTSA